MFLYSPDTRVPFYGLYYLFPITFDVQLVSNVYTQWVARLTRNVKVLGSSPIKGPRCFIEQDTLPLLLVLVGCRIRALFHNQTKLN